MGRPQTAAAFLLRTYGKRDGVWIMEKEEIRRQIEEGSCVIGIELGSTRIKAVLTGSDYRPAASGSFDWENRYENGYWTYAEEEIISGLKACFLDLKKSVMEKYGIVLRKARSIGISAMMHGYLASDENDRLLVPFRTWRNTTTAEASAALTKLFAYPVPERWSVSHLYQAILNREEHVSRIRHLNTLSSLIHYRLSGERVLGIGDASGMFPVSTETRTYDASMADRFDQLINGMYPWKIRELLPEVRTAGQSGGYLSEEGALLLDPEGDLQSGIPMCPPEGDAGTGMTATNSVKQKTGNVSAGTSVFSMVVLEQELKNVYPQIDLVMTPDGSLTAMVHCNNCTSDINAWVNIFDEVLKLSGVSVKRDELFRMLFLESQKGEQNCGGLLNYNFISAEPLAGVREGLPVFMRTAGSEFTLAGFMRAQIFSAFSVLKKGMDLLSQKENVRIEVMQAHGGIFRTPGVADRYLAAALNTRISVPETAGEGGPWGMTLLAAYMTDHDLPLPEWLQEKVFRDTHPAVIEPEEEETKAFAEYMEKYEKGLPSIRKAAMDLND